MFRWHVRTKDNIARVRRDELKAAEEAKELERRIKLADQESRTAFLRERAQKRLQQMDLDMFSSQRGPGEDPAQLEPLPPPQGQPEHVNFFRELEAGETTANTNKERQEELKKEQEEYEKKVGYLTYLGQDSQELTGERSWWQKLPEDRRGDSTKNDEDKLSKNQRKHVDSLDPLNSIKRYLSCEGVKAVTASQVKVPPSTRGIEENGVKRAKKAKGRHKRKKSKKDSKGREHRSKKKKRSRRSSSSSSSDGPEGQAEVEEKRRKLEALRKERLEREKREQARKIKLLYGVDMEAEPKGKKIADMTEKELVESRRKYSSQFNPHLAKQNKLDANKKYWLDQ